MSFAASGPAVFDLSVPAWELVARAAILYFALLVMVRVSGKRTVGQFTPFDLLVVLLLSETVSAALSAGDNSVTAGLLLAGTLIGLNLAVAYATSRSEKLERIVQGRPVLVGRDGEVFREKLRSQHMSQADFDQALREAGCEMRDMRCAFLEVDGTLSILKKDR